MFAPLVKSVSDVVSGESRVPAKKELRTTAISRLFQNPKKVDIL